MTYLGTSCFYGANCCTKVTDGGKYYEDLKAKMV